jgi:hypothetical protein
MKLYQRTVDRYNAEIFLEIPVLQICTYEAISQDSGQIHVNLVHTYLATSALPL